MNLFEFFEQLQGIFDDSGDPTDYGCSKEEVSAFKRVARDRHPEKPVCVVADWKWLDVPALEDNMNDSPRSTEEYLQFVVARTIVEDEADRRFNSVFTSRLVDFSDGCIFCTRNTAYILVGPGKRRTVVPEVLAYASVHRAALVLSRKPGQKD